MVFTLNFFLATSGTSSAGRVAAAAEATLGYWSVGGGGSGVDSDGKDLIARLDSSQSGAVENCC